MPDSTTKPALLNPSGLCSCGCGQAAPIAKRRSHGANKGEHLRYIPGHHRRKSPTEWIVDTETGCWVWQRARLKCGGYGVRRINGTLYRVHRLNYEAKYGPIPEGTVPHHRCENPACVNPDHLEIVTNARNIQMSSRAKLNPLWALVIREMGSMGCSSVTIARAIEFHVGRLHKTTIESVIKGQSWI